MSDNHEEFKESLIDYLEKETATYRKMLSTIQSQDYSFWIGVWGVNDRQDIVNTAPEFMKKSLELFLKTEIRLIEMEIETARTEIRQLKAK